MKISQRKFDQIAGAFGVALMGLFIFGLAASISSGFAGFWGGLPFWVITIVTSVLIIYEYWETCFHTPEKPEPSEEIYIQTEIE